MASITYMIRIKKERSHIDTLLIHTLYDEFSNKFVVTKKLVRWNHSYLNYALVLAFSAYYEKMCLNIAKIISMLRVSIHT